MSKLFWLFSLIAAISFALLFGSGFIENPDTQLRLHQTKRLVEKGTLTLPDDVGELTHGNICYDVNGKRISTYMPGQTLLFTPVYFSVRFVKDDNTTFNTSGFIVSFFNLIIHFLTAILLFKLCLHLSLNRNSAFWAAFLFLLTSYGLSFAQDSYEHHIEALFVISSVLLVIRGGKEKSTKLFIGAGFMVLLGVVFRSSTLFIVPGILFIISNWKYRGYFMIGVICAILFNLSFNYLRFNDFLNNGYTQAWSLAFGSSFKSFWVFDQTLVNTLYLLFSPAKGLLFYSPTLLLLVFIDKERIKENKRILIGIGIIVLMYLLVHASNFAWHGSAWAWGPRYIYPVVPLLFIGMIFLISKVKKFFWSILVLGLIYQVVCMSVYYNRHTLRTLNEKGDVFWNSEYYLDWNNTPIYSQSKELLTVSEKIMNSERTENLRPNGAWKNEKRMGINSEVLNNDIDFNSINFWWVKHFKDASNFNKIIIVLMLVMSISVLFYYAKSIKRYLYELD